MIDLKLLRENPDLVRDALKRRNSSYDPEPLLSREKVRRQLITEIEQLRSKHKKGSDAFGQQRAAGIATGLPNELKKLSDHLKVREEELTQLEEEMERELAIVVILLLP